MGTGVTKDAIGGVAKEAGGIEWGEKKRQGSGKSLN